MPSPTTPRTSQRSTGTFRPTTLTIDDGAASLSGRHGGIITIPQQSPQHRRQLRAALMLDWLGTLDEHRSRMFQWNDLQGRLLSGLRLPGYSEAEISDAVGRPPEL